MVQVPRHAGGTGHVIRAQGGFVLASDMRSQLFGRQLRQFVRVREINNQQTEH